MRLHTTFPVPARARGASAAMGNFDGVHLGHQWVIDQARNDAPLGIVTFEPHPRELFQPDAPPFRLMNREARRHRLDKIGVAHLFEIPFNEKLASLSAADFAAHILARDLGLSHVAVGADFRFGKGREGDAPMLKTLGAIYGFDVTIAPLKELGDMTISSTAIREALSDGKPDLAARMLGHWHRIDGVVEHGHKRGRELGYPTANLSLDGLHLPKFGVYAVAVDVLTGPHKGSYHGAASLGSRPTFGDFVPILEPYLFDFEGDLYGEDLSVALVAFLRPEEKFDGLQPLIDQMNADCAQAKEILTEKIPLPSAS
ncbi:bifunctional riboflavin kinase/FAD synthetase [Paracoccaceae bacterium GXU_MW_L88]